MEIGNIPEISACSLLQGMSVLESVFLLNCSFCLPARQHSQLFSPFGLSSLAIFILIGDGEYLTLSLLRESSPLISSSIRVISAPLLLASRSLTVWRASPSQ